MIPIVPFDFSWCYEPDADGEGGGCDILQLGDPAGVTPLRVGIANSLTAGGNRIVIHPMAGTTHASPTDYHFVLSFTPGILAAPAQIGLASDSWDLHVVSDANADWLYLLWKGIETTLETEAAIEVVLTGLAAESAVTRLDGLNTTNVTISWQFQQGRIDVISIEPFLPGQDDEYATTTTLELEMVNLTGKSNIPLFVGFVSSNRVLNLNDGTSTLQLRLTNTNFPGSGSSEIVFHYDSNPSDASRLALVLEVGDPETVPWALATADQANNIVVSLGEQWRQNGAVEEIKVGNEVRALQWTFIPKSADVVLRAQETMLIDLQNIVTAHPTGAANLYLRYHNLPVYRDGQFLCSIEKAPLIFDGKRVGIGRKPLHFLDVIGTIRGDVLRSEAGIIGSSLEIRRGGIIRGDKLNVTGSISGRSLNISKADEERNLDVSDGGIRGESLDISGAISGQSLNVTGTIEGGSLDVGTGRIGGGILAIEENARLGSGSTTIKHIMMGRINRYGRILRGGGFTSRLISGARVEIDFPTTTKIGGFFATAIGHSNVAIPVSCFSDLPYHVHVYPNNTGFDFMAVILPN